MPSGVDVEKVGAQNIFSAASEPCRVFFLRSLGGN
jgi:hypothetical protein